MKKLALAAVIVGLVGACSLALALNGGPEPDPADFDAYFLDEHDPAELVGQRAVWAGYPLGRPPWCSAPGDWTMTEFGRTPTRGGVVIPACELDGRTIFVGLWPGSDDCVLSQEPAGEHRGRLRCYRGTFP